MVASQSPWNLAMISTDTMRALVLEGANLPFLLREVPRPTAGPGQVLVRIAASGVNPLDSKIRAGKAATPATSFTYSRIQAGLSCQVRAAPARSGASIR